MGRPAATMWARRQRVERMLLRGITNQRDIAAAMGVTEKTIFYDVKAIQEQWYTPEKAAERRTRRIKQLEAIMQEAYNAYDRSKKNAEEESIITRPCRTCGGMEVEGDDQGNAPPPCPTCGGEGVVREVITRAKGRTGDPAYLDLIKNCVKEIARLEGLYITKHAIKGMPAAQQVIINAGAEAYKDAPTDLLLNARQAIALLKGGANIIDGTFSVHEKRKSSSDEEDE